MKRAILILGLMTSVAGCTAVRESSLNPANWFGAETSETSVTDLPQATTDPRPLVESIASLRVDATPEGAIIWAVGVPAAQGFWAAELVRVDGNPSILSYAFRVAPPPRGSAIGTQQSREIIVGTTVSNSDLAGVRAITVVGAQNQRSVRR